MVSAEGCLPGETLPPVDGMTDVCEHITFPRTTVAGGNENKFKNETMFSKEYLLVLVTNIKHH